MRTYGRIVNPDGSKSWVVVQTDANGFNDAVYLTTLCQVLLLNINESPFYSQYGIPDVQTIIQQVQPDFYLARTQQQFAPYFASLILTKLGSRPPAYRIAITTNQGARVITQVPE